MRLTKILLISLLILFPFGEVLRFNLGNNIFLKPLDVVSILLLCWIAFLSLSDKKFRHSIKWYFLLFPIIGLLSLGINNYWLKPNELLTSFLYLLRWVAYLSVFFAVLQIDERFKKKIIKFLIVDGLIILLLGYIQYFLYPSLRNLFYLGWDEHLYRMFSTFLDPNFVGAFFVLYLIFVAGLMFGKTKTKKISRRMMFLYSVVIIATLLGVFLTFSRSALLMLLVSGVMFFILMQRRKFILFLIGAIIIFVILLSPYFYIENLNLFRVNSSIARISTMQNALRIVEENPLIGVGFDSYRYAQIRDNLIKQNSQFPSNSAAGVDTSLLFAFATTGIFGLIAYCYLWFQLFKKAKSNFIQKKTTYSIIFLSSACGLFINSLFINSLFYPEIMLWLWMIAGLLYKEK